MAIDDLLIHDLKVNDDDRRTRPPCFYIKLLFTDKYNLLERPTDSCKYLLRRIPVLKPDVHFPRSHHMFESVDVMHGIPLFLPFLHERFRDTSSEHSLFLLRKSLLTNFCC